jgi:hypothetical protein
VREERVNLIWASSDAISRLTAMAAGAQWRQARSGPTLRSAIFGLDERLRRTQGIIEYCSQSDCVLRICVRRARSAVILADGGSLARGELMVDLHYLNEHLPGPGRGGLEQGAGLRRRLLKSFRALAVALEQDSRLTDVRAVRARMNSPLSRRPYEMARFAARFGLEPARRSGTVSLAQRAHELGEDVWLCALAWAYDPETLGRRAVLRWRGDVWMSGAQLIERFGGRGPAASRRIRKFAPPAASTPTFASGAGAQIG